MDYYSLAYVLLLVVMGLCLLLAMVLLFALGAPAMFRARIRSMMPSGRTEVGLKLVDGTIAGLPHGWSSGTVDLGPDGWLTFHSYVWGVRGMYRPPVRMQITGVVDGVPRRPGWRRMLRVMWFTRIIVLRASTGTVELAIESESAPWLLGRLFAPGPASVAMPGPPPAAVPGPPPAAVPQPAEPGAGAPGAPVGSTSDWFAPPS